MDQYAKKNILDHIKDKSCESSQNRCDTELPCKSTSMVSNLLKNLEFDTFTNLPRKLGTFWGYNFNSEEKASNQCF